VHGDISTLAGATQLAADERGMSVITIMKCDAHVRIRRTI
jgi:hypothetical protein